MGTWEWEPDQAVLTAMKAAADDAHRRGHPAPGSEHLLLILVAGADPAAEAVRAAHPGLTPDRVREAVSASLDDVARLARLGLDPDLVRTVQSSSVTAGERAYTSELLHATLDCGDKWQALVRQGELPQRFRESGEDLWLAVLEPTARSHRLLTTLGELPDDVRTTVLGHMIGPDRPVPAWPSQVRRRLPQRVVVRLLDRLNRPSRRGYRYWSTR